ncbi:death domain-associated protein 6-like isoform X2 [Belonocnema kinseyi]|uniref:death domain-associated protein 6-like isoform X2 n=1 Tax=Belonocnema kinseyi TaxID=2817044 RepID=UPI00143D9E6C|nr:death domain-associated protein 6-like isoform X2 [Belonocnema kinseyi]
MADVICISSDGDDSDDAPRKSLKTKRNLSLKSERMSDSMSSKQDSFDKSSKSVSDVRNGSDTQNGRKSENIANGFIKDDPIISQSPIFQTGAVSILKRKTVADDEIKIDKMVSIPVKRLKLTQLQSKVSNSASSSPKPSVSAPSNNENSSHSNNDRDSPTPGCSSWYPEVEKPTLVIKEREVLYDDEFDLFSTFIQTCLKRDSSNDMKAIVKKLKKKHERLHPTFLNSDNFKQLLIDKQQMISDNKGKLFVHIQDVHGEMKHGARRSRSLEKNARKDVPNADKDGVKNGVDGGEKERKEESELDRHEERRKRKKIKDILNSIEVCKKRIKQLEEEDVDLDDDESSYLIVDKYKRKLMQLWNGYCKYSGEKVDAGRAYLRPKHISATLITPVDQAIMSFINSKISKRNELIAKGRSIADTIIFPDYLDILNCIAACNEKYNLDLTKTSQEIKAKEAFIKIGEHLQRVRQSDYWDTFSLYLEEEDDDPALKDDTLAEKLARNFSEGKKKMADILETFTQKQESRGEELKENGDLQRDDEVDEKDDDEDENEEDEKEDEERAEEEKEEEEKEEDEEDQVDLEEKEAEEEEREEDREEEDEKKDDDDDHEMSSLAETKSPDTPTVNNMSKEDEPRDSPKPSTNDSSKAENETFPENSSSEVKDSSSGDMDVIEVDEEASSSSKKQPILRLRSFAKPPTSWDDSLQPEGSPNIKTSPNIKSTPTFKGSPIIKGSPVTKGANFATSTPKPLESKVNKVSPGPTFVDLTDISDTLKPGIRRVTDAGYVSALKGKFKTVVVPSNFKGKQIISVKNITNNYNVVNAPGTSATKSASKTTIRLPGQSSTAHMNPRKPGQIRVNKVPEDVQRKLMEKNSFKSAQIVPKPGARPVYYQPTSNPNIFTNPEGQSVRLKTIVPNPEAKIMKVLSLNEARKVSITPLQKHRVSKVLMSPKGSQSGNSLSPKKIQIGSRIDHQYSKKIVNNVVRIMNPTPTPAPGEQNYHSTFSDRQFNK